MSTEEGAPLEVTTTEEVVETTEEVAPAEVTV